MWEEYNTKFCEQYIFKAFIFVFFLCSKLETGGGEKKKVSNQNKW